MSNDNVTKLIQPGTFDDQLTDVLRNGARCLLAQAVEAEVAEFLARHSHLKTAQGHQRAVRHGDAIYVFDKFGNATALDLRYRPLPQQAPDAAAVRTAWEALTRFRNR